MIISELPRLLREAVIRRDLRLFCLALDLMVPPLALLALLLVIGLLLGATGVLLGTGLHALGLAMSAALLYALGVLLAWSRFGRSVVPFSALALSPLYVMSKIPMYLGFLYRRQTTWVRTKRDRRNR
jgi:hypothetical protein